MVSTSLPRIVGSVKQKDDEKIDRIRMGSADQENCLFQKRRSFLTCSDIRTRARDYAVRGDSTNHFSSMLTSDRTIPPQKAAIKV
jgi:hypothetical protein